MPGAACLAVGREHVGVQTFDFTIVQRLAAGTHTQTSPDGDDVAFTQEVDGPLAITWWLQPRYDDLPVTARVGEHRIVDLGHDGGIDHVALDADGVPVVAISGSDAIEAVSWFLRDADGADPPPADVLRTMVDLAGGDWDDLEALRSTLPPLDA